MSKEIGAVIDRERMISALTSVIKVVESRVNVAISKPTIVRSDGTVDHMSNNALASDLDDLCTAHLVLKQLLSFHSTTIAGDLNVAANTGKDEPLLGNKWKSWVALLLWDSDSGGDDALKERQSYKYVEDSLRSLLSQKLFPGSRTKTLNDRMDTLLESFHSGLQDEQTMATYSAEMTNEIKKHQERSLKKIQSEIDGMAAYAESLPESTKKTQAKALIKQLESHKESYLKYLDSISIRASAEEQTSKSKIIFRNFAERKVFFDKNREFTRHCIREIQTAGLAVHRDRNLKVILTNIVIALTVVGLFALAIRAVYANVFNPDVSSLFFSKTRGDVKARRLTLKLEEMQQIKLEPEAAVMHENPMHRAAAAKAM